jgi:outer membrane protein assembly factor BamA
MKTLNQSMDWAEEVQERTRNFWQEHGYFKVKVEDASTLVSDSPNGQVFSVLAAVTPGTQYRLKKLVFDEAKGITTQELATMFPISPGDIFDVQKIRTGFENLRRAYPASYKDWLFAPYTEINDSDHTIVLRMRLHGDEELSGK